MGDRKASDAKEGAGESPVEPSEGGKTRAREINAHIGRHLKALYNEVAREPVPDRFIQLLDQLDQKMRGE